MELKNDIAITGTLISVDQYLNVKLVDITVVEGEKYPQLVGFAWRLYVYCRFTSLYNGHFNCLRSIFVVHL